MKKLLMLLLAVAMLTSCGKDGQDGDVYIRFDWDWYVDAFEDNNSDTPIEIYKGVDYLTTPGTYTYTYWCSDLSGGSWTWSGTYTLEANEGKPGGLIADGADGEDVNYLFMMYGDQNGEGPTVTPSDLQKDNEYQIRFNMNGDLETYEKVPEGEMIEEIFYTNSGRLIITKQKHIYVKR